MSEFMRQMSKALWESKNPLLEAGAYGWETDTGKTKRGDGVRRWLLLPYQDVPPYTVPEVPDPLPAWLSQEAINASAVSAVEVEPTVQPTGLWDFTQPPTVGGVELGTDNLAAVALSGSYSDLTNKPSIPETPADIGAQPAGSYAIPSDLTVKAPYRAGLFTPPSAPVTVVSTMDSGWTKLDQGAAVHDTVVFDTGVGSLKMTAPGVTAQKVTARLTFANQDWSGSAFDFRFRTDNWANIIDGYLLVSTSGVFTQFYRVQITPRMARVVDGEWSEVTVARSDFDFNSGTADWSTVNGVMFQLYSAVGTTPSLWIDQFIRYPTPTRATISFAFDDGFVSAITEAKPVLDKYGFRGSAYVMPTALGTAGYMSQAQVDVLAAAGWDIGGHNVTDLTTLSAAQAETDVSATKRYLVDRGYKGGDVYAYPLGGQSFALRSMVAKYFNAARGTSTFGQTRAYVNRRNITTRQLGPTITTAAVQAWITQAVANNEWLIITGHAIRTPTTTAEDYTPANFATVVDAVAASGVQVLTVSEALAAYDAPHIHAGSTSTTVVGQVNSAVVTGVGAADQAATLQAEIDALSAAGGGVLNLPRGIINISSIKLKHLVSLRGRGKQITVLRHAFTTSEAGAVTVATGPVFANIYDLEIKGTGIAGKHGLYIQAQGQATTPFHGGWWFSEISNVIVRDFAGDQIWLRGGGEDSLKPIQFCTFTDVEAYCLGTRAALRMTGQVGQINFVGNCIFSGGNNATQTGTNIVITEEVDDALTYISNKACYALRFEGTTSERNVRGVYARQVVGLNWSGGYMETIGQGIYFDTVSLSATVQNSIFANVGVNAGSGYVVQSGGGSRVVASGNLIGGAVPDNDFVVVSAQMDLLGNSVNQGRQIKTQGLTTQVSVGVGGAVSLGGSRTALVNTSTTKIQTIDSTLPPGETVSIRAWEGPITFTTVAGTGNLTTLGADLVVPWGHQVTFMRYDKAENWVLFGKSF